MDYCIVLYLQPVLNPKSYDGARVLKASGRPINGLLVHSRPVHDVLFAVLLGVLFGVLFERTAKRTLKFIQL